MKADNTQKHELTKEELQLALDAGSELLKITEVLELMTAAYTYRAAYKALYSTRVYKSLHKRREELREMLLDLG